MTDYYMDTSTSMIVEYNALNRLCYEDVNLHIGKIEHNWKAWSACYDYFPVAWSIANMF